MSILSITNDEVLNLCRLDTGDSANIADATEIIGKGQDGYEAMLRPDALSDSTLTALLRRGVAKLLAADLLGVRRRADGAAISLQGAGITLGTPPNLGTELRQEAMQMLAPYLRAVKPAPVSTTPNASPASQSAQSDLYGDTESQRQQDTE